MLAIALGSCQISKPRAKKKLDCIVKLYPELIENDTVIVRDTIIREKKILVPEYRDSFIIEHDTIIETKEVIIEKKGTQYKFITKEKEIILKDTIHHEVAVPGKVITIQEKYPIINLAFLFLLGFVVGTVIVYMLRL